MAVDVLGLRIELVDDLVLSASSASSGGHQGLTHISGAALRGLFAGRLYGRAGIDSYLMFHSGKVRFGDGWPVCPGDAVALPLPLSLHYDKRDEGHYKSNGRLNNSFVHNRARPNGATVTQPVQIRKGYLDPTSLHHEPSTDLRMKTAIDAATGRSAEAQLFGYQGLAAGQSFMAVIEGPKPQLEELRRVVAERRFRLGRSRRAEYGRIDIEEVDVDAEVFGTDSAATDAGDLVVWALSDLALVGDNGLPTPAPNPEAFCGVPGYSFTPTRSWLRTRRYLPWNAHWGMPEIERVVIAAGSVLVFEPVAATAAAAVPARWVGIGNEAGLGRVWANPAALGGETLERWSGVRLHSVTASSGSPSDADFALIDWLRARHGVRERASRDAKVVRAKVDELTGHIESAAALTGQADRSLVGPGVSQWREVATTVSKAASRQELERLLFNDDSGVAREKDVAWKQRFGTSANETFSLWLKERAKEAFDNLGDDPERFADVRQYLHKLADAIADRRQRDER